MAVAAHLALEGGARPTVERFELALGAGSEAIACQLAIRGSQDAEARFSRIRSALLLNSPYLADVLVHEFLNPPEQSPIEDVSREELQALLLALRRDETTANLTFHAAELVNEYELRAARRRFAAFDEEHTLPDAQGSEFTEALHAHDLSALEALLAAGLDANGTWKSRPLLEHALDADALDAMRVLLAAGADADPAQTGWLLTCAAKENRVGALRILVEGGVHVDTPTVHGGTALHVAVASRRSRDSAAALLELGADPNAKNTEGRTVWECAQVEFRKTLEKHGAYPRGRGPQTL
ncbi:MAG: ankyrin repeat domain-containing protein [Myxococcota bacterium]